MAYTRWVVGAPSVAMNPRWVGVAEVLDSPVAEIPSVPVSMPVDEVSAKIQKTEDNEKFQFLIQNLQGQLSKLQQDVEASKQLAKVAITTPVIQQDAQMLFKNMEPCVDLLKKETAAAVEPDDSGWKSFWKNTGSQLIGGVMAAVGTVVVGYLVGKAL